MKVLFRLLTAFFLLLSLAGQAQPHLTVTNITGFPFAPGDTAFEVQTYPLTIQILNSSSQDTLSDTLDVFIQKIFPTIGPLQTLYTDSTPILISPASSTVVTNGGYNFDPQFYDNGDNIVVVWPQARTMQHTADTLTASVYFVSFNSSVGEIDGKTLEIFPNPATEYVILKSIGPGIQQVRISDMTGREVYSDQSGSTWLPVRDLPQGIYIVEVSGKDGKTRLIRMIRRRE